VVTRSGSWARERFAAARFAVLATVGPDGVPHLVPLVFAVVADGADGADGGGDLIVSAVDHKPKRTTSLRRLANIRATSRVSLLVESHDEDWGQLWWARADGEAEVHASYDVAPLVAKYPQYAERPPAGPVIVVRVARWSGWSAS
jgi:PPOX class probable F420-dependent enzyme